MALSDLFHIRAIVPANRNCIVQQFQDNLNLDKIKENLLFTENELLNVQQTIRQFQDDQQYKSHLARKNRFRVEKMALDNWKTDQVFALQELEKKRQELRKQKVENYLLIRYSRPFQILMEHLRPRVFPSGIKFSEVVEINHAIRKLRGKAKKPFAMVAAKGCIETRANVIFIPNALVYETVQGRLKPKRDQDGRLVLRSIVFIPIDLDLYKLPSFAERFGSESRITTVEADELLLSFLKTRLPEGVFPDSIVRSGSLGGYHLYFHIEPEILNFHDNGGYDDKSCKSIFKATYVQKALADLLDADQNALGLTQPFGLPETLSHKPDKRESVMREYVAGFQKLEAVLNRPGIFLSKLYEPLKPKISEIQNAEQEQSTLYQMSFTEGWQEGLRTLGETLGFDLEELSHNEQVVFQQAWRFRFTRDQGFSFSDEDKNAMRGKGPRSTLHNKAIQRLARLGILSEKIKKHYFDRPGSHRNRRRKFYWNEKSMALLGIQAESPSTNSYYHAGERWKGIQRDAAKLAKIGCSRERIIAIITEKVQRSSQMLDGCKNNTTELRSAADFFTRYFRRKVYDEHVTIVE